MVILPDGAKMDMQWKSVKYINHGDSINFQIVPMYNSKDLVLIPNNEKWKQNNLVFSLEEREEIIFLLERINWKREIKIIELNIPVKINSEFDIIRNSLEYTDAYIKMTKENLFDNDSMLTKEQVKSLYLSIEKRFAENLQGEVKIPKDILLEGSVMKDFVIPILEKNKNAKIEFI